MTQVFTPPLFRIEITNLPTLYYLLLPPPSPPRTHRQQTDTTTHPTLLNPSTPPYLLLNPSTLLQTVPLTKYISVHTMSLPGSLEQLLQLRANTLVQVKWSDGARVNIIRLRLLRPQNPLPKLASEFRG